MPIELVEIIVVKHAKYFPQKSAALTSNCSECCERLFFDQGEFEAIQTLNGHRTPRCDKHHFHAKMTVIT